MKHARRWMTAFASAIVIAAGCQFDLVGEGGDGGRGGAGGTGAPTTTQQGGSTTKSNSNGNSNSSTTVSTTDTSTTSGDACNLNAGAQTGGPSPYYCFGLTVPCPTQEAAECYLNRYCELGEAGLDVIGGPMSSIPASSAVSSSGTSGPPPNLCCYLTVGKRCYPTSSSGSSVSGGFMTGGSGSVFPTGGGSTGSIF